MTSVEWIISLFAISSGLTVYVFVSFFIIGFGASNVFCSCCCVNPFEYWETSLALLLFIQVPKVSAVSQMANDLFNPMKYCKTYKSFILYIIYVICQIYGEKICCKNLRFCFSGIVVLILFNILNNQKNHDEDRDLVLSLNFNPIWWR